MIIVLTFLFIKLCVPSPCVNRNPWRPCSLTSFIMSFLSYPLQTVQSRPIFDSFACGKIWSIDQKSANVSIWVKFFTTKMASTFPQVNKKLTQKKKQRGEQVKSQALLLLLLFKFPILPLSHPYKLTMLLLSIKLRCSERRRIEQTMSKKGDDGKPKATSDDSNSFAGFDDTQAISDFVSRYGMPSSTWAQQLHVSGIKHSLVYLLNLWR